MGCVQSYFKRAHNAGISPSSTQESNSKQPASEDGTRALQEERSITEEPESNDTSYGVEATAVRTLAATTGTVAILGTTAKTGDKKDEDTDGRDSASPAIVETIPEEQEESTVNVEKAVVHEQEKVEVHNEEPKENGSKPSSASSRPVSVQLEESVEKKEESVVEEKIPTPLSSSNETKEDNPPSESPAVSNKSPLSEQNKSETASPEVKSPVLPAEETEPKNAEENASELIVSELAKDKEDDVSKSISSERLKTNSISNTTLSSDSIADLENNSVKQSPSGDKVVESFDSSSTVEFVDVATRDAKDGQQEDTRTNPARSISSDLSNRASLPVDGEKTPDVLSPVEPLEDIPPPPLEAEQAVEATSLDIVTESPTKIEKEEVPQNSFKDKEVSEVEQEEASTNSSLKEPTLNDENSANSEVSSNMSSSVMSVVKNDTNSQDELNSKNAAESSSPVASEEINKAETGSPFSSDNNSSFNDNGEAASPVTAVILSSAPSAEPKEQVKVEKTDSAASNKSETMPELTNGISSKPETPKDTPVDKSPSPIVDNFSKTNVDVKNSLESISSKTPEHTINGEVSDDVFGSPIDISDEKVVAAATTIQASFRGFQARQNLKTGEKDYIDEKQTIEKLESEAKKSIDSVESNPVKSMTEDLKPSLNEKSESEDQKSNVSTMESEIKKSIETVEETPLNSVSEGFDSTTEQPDSILEDVDEKMVAAATTIQANFRGFQTRQGMKNKGDSGLPASEETNQSIERKTPTALTPELIESVREEVDDICKEAETIAAERSESAEGMMKGVEQVVVETKHAALPSVSESVQAVRGSASPPSVSEGAVEDTEDNKEEVFESLLDADEKTINAATTIQATFRGFQARKNMQDQTQEQPDSMPDFPPPVAEEEYLQSLEDLPPPDFEALESSYSEEVPTEPLAPPPDSLVFNEEDEDELMALQRPAECDELPEHRLTLETDSSESSLSSAATKIQAGVRGYLTRKQMQEQVQSGTGTGTSTSTNLLDSDQSLSVSREDDGVRSAISTEEESEVCRHRASPDSDTVREMAGPRPSRSATKRMSLGSVVTESPPARTRAPLRSALSVQGPAPTTDEEVWDTLRGEMADAATRIQSNFRGYRARKQLQREDAVQVTSSSSQATPSSGSVEVPGRGSAGGEDRTARSSGEYHDIIALTPPSMDSEGGGAPAQSDTVAGQPADDMVKRRAEDDAKESAAATKIQATFRGFKSRQEMKEVDLAAAKIQAGFRGYKVRKEMKKNERVRRSSNPEKGEKSARLRHTGSVEESAATKIQAGVRGFLVRRRYQKEQDAATKIQAGFRGFQSRKQAPADQ